MPPFRLGITGGPAAGKTTVLRMLAELGYKTASADEAARGAFEDPVTQRQLAVLAGLPEPLERRSLARAIAERPDIRRAVNGLLHTEVLARLLESRAEVIEAPLLLESCIQAMFQRVWVVACNREEQVRRLTERLGSAQKAESQLAIQLAPRVKSAFADHLLRTDRPIGAVLKDVEELADLNLRA